MRLLQTGGCVAATAVAASVAAFENCLNLQMRLSDSVTQHTVDCCLQGSLNEKMWKNLQVQQHAGDWLPLSRQMDRADQNNDNDKN